MIEHYYVRKIGIAVLTLFVGSIIVLSIVGAYIGLKGKQRTYDTLPTQIYEEISFSSNTRDNMQLFGWFFPAQSNQVVAIVHGWGGHRARYLPLAEFLQRNQFNVLTFDLRGGTGKNTYGLRESGDLAGAIDWLKQTKGYTSDKISVIGISIGGAATVDYATKNDVKKLVLLGPIVDIGHAKYATLKDRRFIFPSLYAGGATLVEWFIYGVRPLNPTNVFDRVSEPTLIIHGTRDHLSPVKDIYALQKKIGERGQNNIEFVIIPDGAHSFIDDDRSNDSVISKKIVDFLQR